MDTATGERRRQSGRVAVVCLLSIAALAGCGPKDDATSSGSPSEPTTASSGSEPDAGDIGATTGVTDTSVTIGLHAPLTLGSVDVEKIVKLRAMSNAYWNAINDAGGINGRKVTLEIADDGYEASSAIQACRELLAKDVFIVLGVAGADQISACGQHVLQQDVPYVSLGQSGVGLVDQPGYHALTITYEEQAPLQAEYVVNELGGDAGTVGFIRYNSANVSQAHDDFIAEFEKLAGGKPAVDDTVSKTPNASELSSECLKLEQAGVRYVSVLAAPTVMSAIADACASTGYQPQYIGWAGNGGCQVDPARLGTKNLDGCLTLQSTRVPESSDAPILAQCRDAWAKYAQAEAGDYPSTGDQACAVFDVIRETLEKTGAELGRTSFDATLSSLVYDNGFVNPIDFDGGSVGSNAVIVAKANAATKKFDEVVSDWTTSF